VSLVFPLMPQHAKELGASPSLIGLFGSIYGAVQFFSSPIIVSLPALKLMFYNFCN